MSPLAVYKDHLTKESRADRGIAPRPNPVKQTSVLRALQERPAALATVAIESVPP